MKNYLYVIVGGALGSLLRFISSKNLNTIYWFNIPIQTIIINILGSFIAGCVLGYIKKNGEIGDSFFFVVTGILGGFTTFSSFSLDFLMLINEGKLLQSAIYVLLSVILSLGFSYAGYFILKYNY